MDIQNNGMTRRVWLQRVGALGLLAAVERLVPSSVWASASNGAAQPSLLSGTVIDLTIAETPFRLDGRTAPAITINGTIPGHVIRLKEGQLATLRVRNRLNEDTSIHWHGLLLPPEMDGVPGVSFAGIKPGTTFTYQFPVRQSGTYWCHVTRAAKSSWACTRR